MTKRAAYYNAKATDPELTYSDFVAIDPTISDGEEPVAAGNHQHVEVWVEKPVLVAQGPDSQGVDGIAFRNSAERAAMQTLHEHAAKLREQLDVAAGDFRDLDADAARATAARSGAAENHNRILRELVSYELFTRVGTDIEWKMHGGRCSDRWTLKGKIVEVWRTFFVVRGDDGQEQVYKWYDADNHLLGLPMELGVSEPPNLPDDELPF